jgi:hypothetical protein
MTLVYGSWETFFSEMIYQTTTTASNLVMTSSFSLGVVPAFATCTAHTLLVFAMQNGQSPQLMNENGQTVPRSYSFFDDMKVFSKGETKPCHC